MAKVCAKEFFIEIEKSKKNKKLTSKSVEFFYNMCEGILLTKAFHYYNDRIKVLMSNYALQNFQRYWKSFSLYDQNQNQNNPYSYFYFMIKRSFFDILKKEKIKEFNFLKIYDQNNLDFLEKSENIDIIFKESIIFKDPKKYYEEDIICDHSEIVSLIEENIKNFQEKEILEMIYHYFNEKIIYKLIKNDKILLLLMNKKFSKEKDEY